MTKEEENKVTERLIEMVQNAGRKYPFDLFEDHRNYVHPKCLFLMLFNHIPSIHIAENTDYTAVVNWMEEKYKPEIVEVHQKNFHGNKESSIGQNVSIFVLKENLLVLVDTWGELNILYLQNQKEKAEKILNELMRFQKQ